MFDNGKVFRARTEQDAELFLEELAARSDVKPFTWRSAIITVVAVVLVVAAWSLVVLLT